MNKLLICGTVSIIVAFSIIGMISAFSTIPNRNKIITMLECRVETRNKKINQYKSAMKFENLFMLVASPNDVMDFEALEEYIQDRKDFYKRAK